MIFSSAVSVITAILGSSVTIGKAFTVSCFSSLRAISSATLLVEDNVVVTGIYLVRILSALAGIGVVLMVGEVLAIVALVCVIALTFSSIGLTISSAARVYKLSFSRSDSLVTPFIRRASFSPVLFSVISGTGKARTSSSTFCCFF